MACRVRGCKNTYANTKKAKPNEPREIRFYTFPRAVADLWYSICGDLTPVKLRPATRKYYYMIENCVLIKSNKILINKCVLNEIRIFKFIGKKVH